MSDSAFLKLPLYLQRRIDEAFSSTAPASNSTPASLNNRAEIDTAGAGFVIPASASPAPTPDEEQAQAQTQIPLSEIPSALRHLDLPSDDAQVLLVFKNAAAGWRSSTNAESELAPDAEGKREQLWVSRDEWRARCAVLLEHYAQASHRLAGAADVIQKESRSPANSDPRGCPSDRGSQQQQNESDFGYPETDQESHHPRSVPQRFESTVFGMRKTRFAAQGYADDYEQKYVPDALYEEAYPNARIWRVYMDEAANFDRDMIEEMRDALDVLLVFAALFSAIVTTFLVQTSQQLSADYGQMTALLIFESIQIQRALANGTALSAIYQSPVNPLVPFKADPTSIWVNTFWFISLTLSLLTALATVLVKQWLRQYMTLPSGTARERASTRHFRYMGFRRWHVAGIVGSLPVLVHISVGLFLAGVTVFLFHIQYIIAIIIAIISGIAFVLYASINIIPVLSPSCPYRTPISDFVYRVSRSWINFLTTLTKFIQNLCGKSGPDTDSFQFNHQAQPMDLRLVEKAVVNTNDGLLAHAVFWLYDMSSNPTVHSIVLQAIGGLPDGSHPTARALVVTHKEIQDRLKQEVETYKTSLQASETIDRSRLERFLRSSCLLLLRTFNAQLSYTFSLDDQTYILAALTASFLQRDQLLSLMNILTDNVYRHYIHRLPAAIWDELLANLSSGLALSCRDDMDFAFVRDICSSGHRNEWPVEMEGLTLAEYIFLSWRYRRTPCPITILLVLPEPVEFKRFVNDVDPTSWDKNWAFAIGFWLLICYYERLSAYSQVDHGDQDDHALKEWESVLELSSLQGELFECLKHVYGSNWSASDPQLRAYEKFLQTALSSSTFWNMNPQLNQMATHSQPVGLVKEVIKSSFSDTLQYLNRLKNPPAAPRKTEVIRVLSTRIKHMALRLGPAPNRAAGSVRDPRDVEMGPNSKGGEKEKDPASY